MKHVLTFVLCMVSLIGFSQSGLSKQYVGLSGGGGLSGAVGLRMEIPLELGINNYLSLRTGAAYIQRGNKEVNRKFTEETTHLTALNYVSVPALIKLKLDFKPIAAYALLGPEFGYGLSAKARLLEENGEYYYNENFSYRELELRRLDLGLSFGIGLESTIRKERKLFVELQYFLGLLNIDREVGSDIYNEGMVISLGFLLPIKD